MSLNREKLTLRFQEEFAKLNEQQQLAVNHIEGPVMVIAGPGTGKTQILASRIGKILLDTDALPENILCLTYTDAGVVATVKFQGPTDLAVCDRFRALPGASLVHLAHNRHELTVLVERAGTGRAAPGGQDALSR